MSASTAAPVSFEGSPKNRRTASDADALAQSFLDNLLFVQGRSPDRATVNDLYMALAHTVRDRLVERWISTVLNYRAQDVRVVCYSLRRVPDRPHLGNNLINLGIYDQAGGMGQLGLDLEELLEQEDEPGLGNGGLGRLAACFIDSLATLEIPAIGYGIRYEFGIFQQEIATAGRSRRPTSGCASAIPGRSRAPNGPFEVKLGGHTERYIDEHGRVRMRWVPQREVVGVPYDTPILGYHVNTANTLRLWRAEAAESFDFSAFNRGDYYGAVDQKVILGEHHQGAVPERRAVQGKELRLEQQFFFVSCSLQDMLRILKTQGIPLERLHEKFAMQLNDTHPSIAVAELMRLLVDEHAMDWDTAWAITRKTFAYTNHTLLPEALERWPLALFGRVLPRHLEIIFEINARFLDEVRIRFPRR